MFRDIHKNNENIPIEYRKLSLHIALERADMNEDWKIFKILYNYAPEILEKHLKNTGFIFDYNYKKLSEQQINSLFSV